MGKRERKRSLPSPNSRSSGTRMKPSESTVNNAKKGLNYALRSIVMSRTTYALFKAFNNCDRRDEDHSTSDDDDDGSNEKNDNNNSIAIINASWMKTIPSYLTEAEIDEAVSTHRPQQRQQRQQQISDGQQVAAATTAGVPDFFEKPSSRADADVRLNLFKTVVDEVKQEEAGPSAAAAGDASVRETDLTKRLAEKMNQSKVFDAKRELGVYLYNPETSDGSKPPSIDIAFAANSGNKAGMIGFIEAGLTRKGSEDAVAKDLDGVFWKKTGQMLRYLELLAEHPSPTDKSYEAKGPLLVCVIVTDRSAGKGRIAVFHAIRKSDPDVEEPRYRIAMLWRRESDTLEELSTSFAAYIAALTYVATHGPSLEDVSETGEKWQYLSRNCTKVTIKDDGGEKSFVLRAYDNRVRQTPRTPYLYKNWSKLRADTRVILHVTDDVESDAGNIVAFGVDDTRHKQSMLFRDDGDAGQVEVIAIPFVDGKHYYKDSSQALGVIRHLKELHNENFVHGDIRGLNMVFDHNTGKLIDFDFGGEADQVKYPPRYARNLTDGSRSGKAGNSISKRDDILALGDVLGAKHEVMDWGDFWITIKKSTDASYILNEMEKFFVSPRSINTHDLYQELIEELEEDNAASSAKSHQEPKAVNPDTAVRSPGQASPSKKPKYKIEIQPKVKNNS